MKALYKYPQHTYPNNDLLETNRRRGKLEPEYELIDTWSWGTDSRRPQLTAIQPGESTTGDFGGNSNWCGPIWFPINFLLVEVLYKYHLLYGEYFMVEDVTGSGKQLTLGQVADELSRRLTSIFLRNEQGHRPVFGTNTTFQSDSRWRDYIPFHSFFAESIF